jgi:hypothetical protein
VSVQVFVVVVTHDCAVCCAADISKLLDLLSKPTLELHQLMVEEDFLQEAAGRNPKLIAL